MGAKGTKIVMHSEKVILSPDSSVFGTKPKPASSPAACMAAAAPVFPRNFKASYTFDFLIVSVTRHQQPHKFEQYLQTRRNSIVP